MMKLTSAARAGTLAIALALGTTSQAQTLRVFTEQWPPYNYEEDGQAKGLAVEMVQALLKESGYPQEMAFLPWNRAYATALKDPNVVLFTLGRTAEREPLFDWIFQVSKREIWLFRLASRSDLQLNTLDDARPFKIGTGAMEDAKTRDLVRKGFIIGKNLDSVQSPDSERTNVEKLRLGRIDFLVATPIAVAYATRKLGMSMEILKPALRVNVDSSGY